MLITRKSRKRQDRDQFRSRFDQGDAFPLRQYMRARDEVVHRGIVALVQTAFGVALLLFAHRLFLVFRRHGANVADWIEWGTILLASIFALSMFWRAFRHLREIHGLREEMRAHKQQESDRRS